MADRVPIDTGGDLFVATDEVGTSGHYQLMKIADGTPDSYDYVKADSTYGLDVDVTRMPGLSITGGTISTITGTVIVDATGQGDVPVTLNGEAVVITGSTIAITGGTIDTIAGTVTVDASDLDIRDLAATTDFITVSGAILSAIQTAVELIDDAINGNEMQVDVVTAPALAISSVDIDIRDLTATQDFVTVSGTILSAIQTAVETIDNAIDGTEMQVDVVTVPALAISSEDIDIRDLSATQDFVTVSGAELTSIKTAVEGTLIVDATGQGDVPITLDDEVVSVVGSTVAVTGGTIVVTDGGGALTVDNAGTFAVQSTLQAGDVVVGRVKITDGSEVANVNSNNRLEISIEEDNAGIGGGKQYTEGETNSTATGTVILGQRSDNTLHAAALSNSDYLRIDIANDSVGIGGGVSYVEGDTAATITGSVLLAEGPSDVIKPLLVDNSQHLQVDIASDSVGIGGGVQYVEGATAAVITGTAILWEDASNVVRAVSVDNKLPVDNTGVTLAVTGGLIDTITSISNTVTVDGTITANLGTIGDVATEATLATISGHVDGIETVLGTIDADTSSMATDISTIAGDTTSIDGKTPALGQGAMAASVPVVIASDQSDINVSLDGEALAITGGTLAVVGGGTEAAALRVTIANDSTGLISIDDGGNTITIDGTVTANLGTLNGAATAANQTTIIGHVDGIETLLGDIETDTTTIAGDTTSIDDKTPALGQATMANSVPVTMASNQADINVSLNNEVVSVVGSTIAVTGGTIIVTDGGTTISVDDGGGALTVDGTVTANLGTIGDIATEATLATISGHVDGIETVLGTIDTDTSSMSTDLTTIAGAVDAGQMQVDVVGSLPGGTNAIGKLAANDGVDIGDVTINNASDIGITGFVRIGDNGDSISIDDGGNTITVDGTVTANLSATDNAVLDAIQASVESQSDWIAATGIDAVGGLVVSGAHTTDAIFVEAPGASKRLAIYFLSVSNHGDNDVEFQLEDGSGGDDIWWKTVASNGGAISEQWNPPIALSANTALYYNYIAGSPSANDVSLHCHYKVVDA